MVTILSVVVVVLALIVVGLTYSHMGMKEQLETFDKEQHTQNTDIINLMKHHIKNQDVLSDHQGMLLQHIEILKYLIDQDPKLNAGKIYFTGPVGEA